MLMYSECVTLQGLHNGLDSLVYRIQSDIDSQDTPGAQASVCASRNQLELCLELAMYLWDLV